MVAAAVEVLNSALEADRLAVNRFFALEMEVNQTLADHPTIQVGSSDLEPESKKVVMRPLGLINGLFGTDERLYGFVYMNTKGEDPDGWKEHFPDDWIDSFYVGPKQETQPAHFQLAETWESWCDRCYRALEFCQCEYA